MGEWVAASVRAQVSALHRRTASACSGRLHSDGDRDAIRAEL